MKTYGYAWRMITLVSSMAYPFLCLLLVGYKKSISSYWGTDVEPIFILCNALTAYYFVQTKRWEIPGALLLLLTAFNIELFGQTHNIFATLFFLSSFIPLIKSKRYKWLLYIYIGGGVLMGISLLVGEIVCILVIGAYHMLILNKYKNLIENHEKDIKENLHRNHNNTC